MINMSINSKRIITGKWTFTNNQELLNISKAIEMSKKNKKKMKTTDAVDRDSNNVLNN